MNGEIATTREKQNVVWCWNCGYISLTWNSCMPKVVSRPIFTIHLCYLIEFVFGVCDFNNTSKAHKIYLLVNLLLQLVCVSHSFIQLVAFWTVTNTQQKTWHDFPLEWQSRIHKAKHQMCVCAPKIFHWKYFEETRCIRWCVCVCMLTRKKDRFSPVFGEIYVRE